MRIRTNLVWALPMAALLALPVGTSAAARSAAIVDAVKSGNTKQARALVLQKTNVNATDVDGSTALHWAAYRGDVDLVDLLLQAGAKAITVNAYGVAPLALAVEGGNPAVVARLVKAGADVNAGTTGGETPLMTAARTGKADVARRLADRIADALR